MCPIPGSAWLSEALWGRVAGAVEAGGGGAGGVGEGDDVENGDVPALAPVGGAGVEAGGEGEEGEEEEEHGGDETGAASGPAAFITGTDRSSN